MATVTYDSKSFRVDGRRIWIVAGEVHYFRHPRAEWRHALLRAKRAGLNTIATYVPWNFHETVEGVVDFAGDKDLAAYLDLIGEMGMYAMVRPGPYICSEWDGGGIPAWLCAKPVRRFREDDPVYVAAVDNWFGKLLPLVAERQVTRGGPVLTVQNENEYPGGWDASMRGYIRKLNLMFAKHGIDVPILACNVHGATETTVKVNDATDPVDQLLEPGMILTYNHHTVVEPVYDLKKIQPDAPLIATEFWCGAPVYWGERVSDWPPALPLARAAYEYTSAATQLVYYMFEGGTNFGFWGGNNIATSYASGYPVGEGGTLTGKYYAIRPPNLFAGQFARFLAGSDEVTDKAGIACPDGIRLVVRRCESGDLVFVSAADHRSEVSLELPGGRRLSVPLGETSAAVIPLGLEVFDGARVDFSNLTLLARCEKRRVLVLFGPAGTEGIVSVNGQELAIPVSRRKVEYRRVAGIGVIVADEEMARRCWMTGGEIILGADYVASCADIRVSAATPEVVRLAADGKPERLHVLPEASDGPAPALSAWTMATCADVVHGTSPGWTALHEPRSHEELGVVQGYVWYSAQVDSEVDGVQTLLLTHTPNRVSVFVNGQFAGAHAERRSVRMRDEYAHPADWAFEELTVRLRKGTNTLVFLSDDLGHNYDVPVPVGIQGPVYAGSRRIEVDSFREAALSPVSADAFHFLYNRFYREPQALPALEFEVPVGRGEQAFLTVHGVPAWVSVDGQDVPPLSYPESPWTMFSQIKRWITWRLPQSGTVRVQYLGDSAPLLQENMMLYVVPEAGRCVNWRWQPWDSAPDFAASQVVAAAGEADKDGIVVLLPVGTRLARKGRTLTPAWFQARFPMPQGQQPVYLNAGQLHKGQIFLNGHNVGRLWRKGGTQALYYLPRSWMTADNRLVIFEELGFHPQDTSLEFGGS